MSDKNGKAESGVVDLQRICFEKAEVGRVEYVLPLAGSYSKGSSSRSYGW